MNTVVGVIGGGQLARMMVPPAINLGLEIRVFAESEGSPAEMATTVVGDYTNVDSVVAFAQACDVITFDHEHVPQSVLTELVHRGISVHPGPEALIFAQDKLLMRARLAELGIPVPGWTRASTAADVDAFLLEYGGRGVAKTARGGYDGKGVRVITSSTDVADWLTALAPGEALLLEEFVEFRRELAQLVARRPSGELALWPVVETVQQNGVCSEVIAPAPHSAGRIADVAAQIAADIAEGLNVTGVMAVELFETTDDRILVNELAMRPHNSGHWSIDGSTTSQFEQHLRAVLDLPLGATGMTEPFSVMVNILGGPETGGLPSRYARAMKLHPTVKIHSYGKESRPGRKVGHITASGEDLAEVAYQARGASAFFQR
ncbi:MAG: 5-(carboxyamino)imidazole ribonucleotide synthase [Actinomycetales bacterium]|nr:5-(carboxyamino)imidazole ribonucleotide synthase [Actinomycetales bacterium]